MPNPLGPGAQGDPEQPALDRFAFESHTDAHAEVKTDSPSATADVAVDGEIKHEPEQHA